LHGIGADLASGQMPIASLNGHMTLQSTNWLGQCWPLKVCDKLPAMAVKEKKLWNSAKVRLPFIGKILVVTKKEELNGIL
jgi:hypothetical protein